jgi:hypothetical protein
MIPAEASMSASGMAALISNVWTSFQLRALRHNCDFEASQIYQ